MAVLCLCSFFFQAEDGIRDVAVTGVQTCALPIWGIPVAAGHGHVAPRRHDPGPINDTGADRVPHVKPHQAARVHHRCYPGVKELPCLDDGCPYEPGLEGLPLEAGWGGVIACEG